MLLFRHNKTAWAEIPLNGTQFFRGVLLLWILAGSLAWSCHYDFGVRAQEENCSDGLDNDGDGKADCLDLDCAATMVCLGETYCDDQRDDDQDGLTDCADPDCADDTSCMESDCSDSIDNDQDGSTDCDDPDCSSVLACQGDHACNANGLCDPPYEDRRWCGDCLPDCSLKQGTNTDFIVTALTLPHDSTEARQMGLDLDGNGDIDNNLGGLIALLSEGQQEDFDREIASKIENGQYIMLLRILADQWPHDETIAVQVFDGDLTDDATEDNLTGDGHVQISSSAPRLDMMCGSLTAPTMVAGPGTMRLPLPMFRKVIYLTTTAAWIVTGTNGSVTQDGMQDVIVAGGWTKDTIDYELAPEVAHYLSIRYLAGELSSSMVELIDSQVDGHCTTVNRGCEEIVNGEGECARWDGDPNTPVVSSTEVRCSVLAAYLQPTVDLDGDGQADVLPVGMRISAVPVTIDN